MRDRGQVFKSHATMARDQRWPDPRCEGAVRVEDDTDQGVPMTVRCDVCGREYGVRRPGTPSANAPEVEDPAAGRAFAAGF